MKLLLDNQLLCESETITWVESEKGWKCGNTIYVDVNKKMVVITSPSEITMRQARLALLNAGLLDNVDTAINSIQDSTQRQAAQIEWEYATTISRDNPLVEQIMIGLGLSNKEIDDLFLTASKL